MNIKILYFLILLFAFSTIQAQTLDEIMKEGNDYYQSNQYEEAISSYEAILKQGYLSGDLYYNLGNSYFRTDRLGKAILYFEKALKLSPSNDDAVHNLQIANSRTVDKIQEIPPLFFVKWWNILLSSFNSIGWQLIIFIFYFLLLVCVGIYFLIRNAQVQKFAFIFGTLNAFAFILASILFISSLTSELSSKKGILLQTIISAKISPDMQSNDAFVIHEGIKFEIEDKVASWVKIKLADGKVGWLPNTSFEEI